MTLPLYYYVLGTPLGVLGLIRWSFWLVRRIPAVLYRPVLEGDRRYRNTNPHCEPQLGKRGLYRMTGGHKDTRAAELAMLWVLNLSDGEHGLLEVAERSGMPFAAVATAASALEACGLLEELPA